MAGSSKQTTELSVKNCKMCGKETKSALNCVKCDSSYHPACAVRAKYVKITGYNKLLCPDCSEDRLIKMSKFELMEISNNLLNEMVLHLYETNSLLKDKIQLLEDKLTLMLKNEVSEKNVIHGDLGLTSNKQKQDMQPLISLCSPVVPNSESQIFLTMNNDNQCSVLTVADHHNTANFNSEQCDINGSVQTVQLATVKDNSMSNCHMSKSPNMIVENKGDRDLINTITPSEMHNKNQKPEVEMLNNNKDLPGSNEIHSNGNRLISNKYKNQHSKYESVRRGNAEDVDDFKPAPRRMWLFVGRASKEMDEDKVKSYVLRKTGIGNEDEVVVKRLSSKSESNSFQVGVPIAQYEVVNSENFWPNGIVFRKFNFRYHGIKTNNENFQVSRKTFRKK